MRAGALDVAGEVLWDERIKFLYGSIRHRWNLDRSDVSHAKHFGLDLDPGLSLGAGSKSGGVPGLELTTAH